ncbi:GNAT family N-acetyltransferase [Fusobacterium sp.]|uniref:GNAT family N-acetyltransferase n=1 Tax=Fusobacterium sp. TaxID=68766 RepID=UPI0028FEA549|nr:GNAT family N-acetyltransferase [Fusobacterium sp.]MDU1909959.1 GNAT family N-acetyltransferase [Fusobacterium sp.]
MREKILETDRLFFSVWKENDMKQAHELWGDPEVTKLITASGKMTEKEIKNRLAKEIENYKNFRVQYFPLYLKENEIFVGCCGLRPYDKEKNILEMGIHIKKEQWGKGIALEGCTKIIEYAFNILKASAVFVGHNPNNIGSAYLIKKLGFTYIEDRYYLPTGLYHPSYIFERK